ncbi:MAG: DUF1080 domain-containing protein, partial [Planctomycetes bacterium]|nr:DUF1080 domain-containing protein [Planctomycetota bacterium]
MHMIQPVNSRLPVLLSFVLLCICSKGVFGEDNRLTKAEKSEGWVLLFDGNSTNGWMTPKGKPLPTSHVQQGSLNPHPCDYMLVYEKPFENFELVLDFKISPKCNSGIFLRTFPLTPRPGKDVGFNGIEVAV